MNIQPIYDYNISMQAKGGNSPGSWNALKDRAKQKVLDIMPEATFKDTSKKLKRLDERMSKPAENRAIMGASAIVLQPIIDLCNKKVDDTTRLMAVCKTVSKIVVGTLVGICVRGGAYRMVRQMTNPRGVTKMSKFLMPSMYSEQLTKSPKLLRNYRSALSTALAITAMLVTNFVIDAPLTALMTNKLTKKIGVSPDTNSKQNKEVTNV